MLAIIPGYLRSAMHKNFAAFQLNYFDTIDRRRWFVSMRCSALHTIWYGEIGLWTIVALFDIIDIESGNWWKNKNGFITAA